MTVNFHFELANLYRINSVFNLPSIKIKKLVSNSLYLVHNLFCPTNILFKIQIKQIKIVKIHV
jgi:hypothetical protein